MEHLDIARTLVSQHVNKSISDEDIQTSLMDFYPIFDHSWIYDDEIGWKVIVCNQPGSKLYVVTYDPFAHKVYISEFDLADQIIVEPQRLVI